MPDNVPPGFIAVVCAQCGMKLFTKPTSIGRVGKCAGCGEMIEMVPLVALPPVQLDPPQAAQVEPPRPATAPPAPALPPPLPMPAAKAPPRPANVPVVRVSFARSATPTAAEAAAPLPPPIPEILEVVLVEPTAEAAPKASVPVKPAPKPSAAAKTAPASGRPRPGAQPAAEKPAAPQAPPPAPVSSFTLRTQVTKPSAETLAKFGKGPAASPQTAGATAIEAWPKPDKPLRIWGQMRQPAEPSGGNPSEAPPAPGPASRMRALAGRVSRIHLLAAAVLVTVVLVTTLTVLWLRPSAAAPPSPMTGEADWSPLDYTTSALPRGKDVSGSTGDTILRVRVKFDIRFSNPGSLTGDDWEIRDAAKPNRPFYKIDFTMTDKTNRIGLLGFIVSGDWRAENLSFRATREEAWASLAKVKCKD
jgi:hypothetical protein